MEEKDDLNLKVANKKSKKKNKEKSSRKIILYQIIAVAVVLMILFFCYYLYNNRSQPTEKNNNPISSIQINIDDLNSILNYYRLLEQYDGVPLISAIKMPNPQISIVIPIYNNEKLISKILGSIQNQSFDNIEIIFVDDCSNDSSISEIKKYQKKDKRIVIISHDEYKGKFISRIDGILNSRGDYILFVEPNGALIPGSLKFASGAIDRFSADIIQFDVINIDNNNTISKLELDQDFNKYKIIMQPNVFKLGFYSFKGELHQRYLNLRGKVIKTELYKKILNIMDDKYKKQNWNIFEDAGLYFCLLKHANSYIYLDYKEYININNDIYNNIFSYEPNEAIKYIFLLSDLFYDFSSEEGYEKLLAINQIKTVINEYKNITDKMDKGCPYFIETIDKFSNSQFVSNEQKDILKKIKEILSSKINKII